jgi:predicted nucleic acid-binding protein
MSVSWICVDASLVVGLVTHGERRHLRRLLQTWQEERRRIAAPSLLYYEIANAAFQIGRHGALSPAAVDALLEMALALPIEAVSDPDLHREAVALARRLSLPATYDAHYLALAVRLDCELWTLDRKLVRSVEGELDRLRLAAGSPG